MEALANLAGVDKSTVYRNEQQTAKGRSRSHVIQALAKALQITPEVLTSEKIPQHGPPRHPSKEPDMAERMAQYPELKVRIRYKSHNNYKLVSEHYRINVEVLASLAPFLFTLLAEASLKRRRKDLEKLKNAMTKHNQFNLQVNPLYLYPKRPFIFQNEQLNRYFQLEEQALERNQLFGALDADDATGVLDLLIENLGGHVEYQNESHIDRMNSEDAGYLAGVSDGVWNPFDAFINEFIQENDIAEELGLGGDERNCVWSINAMNESLTRERALVYTGGHEAGADYIQSGSLQISDIPIKELLQKESPQKALYEWVDNWLKKRLAPIGEDTSIIGPNTVVYREDE